MESLPFDETQFAAYAIGNDVRGKVVYVDGDRWSTVELDDEVFWERVPGYESFHSAVRADAGTHFFALVKSGERLDVIKYPSSRGAHLVNAHVEANLQKKKNSA